MIITFWSNDPSILFNKEFIFELWPTSNMFYEQKLNAITRLVILLSLLGFIFTNTINIIVVCVITLISIYILYKLTKQSNANKIINEGFYTNNSKQIINPVTLQSVIDTEFKEGTKKNPFSNVLLTDIMDNPDKKSAPPSFNPEVDENITRNIKKGVQFMNSGINNTNKQLYGDLWEKFELDQSNRAFFSTANTRVTNDQSAFAQFLYNDLKYSGKESTPEGALTREADSYRYTLY
jgi:hypothetical protein